MTKITILSSAYWKNLFYDLKNLFKFYPVQILSSLLIAAAIVALVYIEGGIVLALVWGGSYFLGTNLLLLIVSEKIEYGMAQNSVAAHILFGTSTDQLKLSIFYWIFKFLVVIVKFIISPLLVIIGLLQYQIMLNKVVAKQELES